MTELISFERAEMEEDTPPLFKELYEEDSVGMLPDDRSALAWKYSRIYGIYGIEAIEELAGLNATERFTRRNEMWQNIIALEREKRSIRPRGRARRSGF